MKQISMVQVHSPITTLIAPAVIPTAPQISQIDDQLVYTVKDEPQVITSIPSTSTAQLIIPTSSEPPTELLVSEVKEEEEEIQFGTNAELNLLTNTDEPLLSSMNVDAPTLPSPSPPPPPAVDDTHDPIDSNEVNMEVATAE